MICPNPSVFFLANAGVYLTDGNSGILIDGLFDHYEGFDSMPDWLEKAILQTEPPFHRLTTLLFTHCHVDHYSREKVSFFVKNHPETRIFLPSDENICPPDLFCRLYPIPSKHLLDRNVIVPHTALFLSYAGQTFFFSGDSDPVSFHKQFPPKTLPDFAKRIDMAFINPFFLSLTPGRRFLMECQPARTFVYHLPIQVPDSLRYHEILERGLKRYQGPTVTPLVEFGKQLS